MKDAMRWIGVLAAGLMLLGPTHVMAQDWPQWRGVNRDGKVSGFTAPQAWPGELARKWKVEVGAGDATPALVGDKLFAFTRQGDEEVTLCLNAADGKEIWRDHYATPAVKGPASRHPGPRSSPAIAEGKVVTLGVGGVLSCLDAASGKVLWRNEEFKAVPKFSTSFSPIIAEGMVIAHLGGQGSGAIIAFDLASGAPKWKWEGEGPGYASPALLTADGVRQLVTLTEKNVVGLALADGKLLWQIPFVPMGMSYNSATPIVDGQTVIFTGQGRGTRAVNIEKQGEKFVPRALWSNPQLAAQFNTPVLKDGLLFGLSDKGTLFCLDARTGQTSWIDSTRHGGSFGALVDAGAVLLALPSDSELIVFKPAAANYQQVAQIRVADSPTFAHPVIAGKRIFVKDQQSLTLLTID